MPLEKGCLWKEASLWKKACGEGRPLEKGKGKPLEKGKEEEKGKGKPLGKGKEEEKGKGKPLGKGKEEEEEEEEEEEGEWVWKPFLGKYRWVKPDHNRMYRRAGTGTTSWKRRAGRVDKQWSSLAEQNRKDKLQKALTWPFSKGSGFKAPVVEPGIYCLSKGAKHPVAHAQLLQP